MYAYAVDGFDWQQREVFDATLNAPTLGETVESPAKARQQRDASSALMAAMSRSARG